MPPESEPNPLIGWCNEEANAKAPLCRNVGSPRVQRGGAAVLLLEQPGASVMAWAGIKWTY